MTDAAQVRLPAAARETVDAFVAGLVARFGARLVEVRLFGSYARGEAHEDSDIDCLVLLESVEPGDERAAANLAGDLTWQIGGMVVSPLVMSPSAFAAWKARERRTALEIEREGIQLYSGPVGQADDRRQ
jgi:predicted nucleotidyltransferase